MAVVKTEAYFNSSDKIHKIRTLIWRDDKLTPIGVVQLAHGMAEHIDRYDDFARFLASNGFVVCGNDHLGHGKSVNDPSEFGFFAEKDGDKRIVDDMHILTKIMKKRYPDIPYFLFGHSMGSFIVRDYIAKYGDELAGATMCGTCGIFRGAADAEKKLAEIVAAGHGKESDPQLAGDLMGWMCERCGDIAIGNEWICANPYVQRDHADDPFDAFTKPTSNQSLYYFTQMMNEISSIQWAEKVPTSLPLYNIGGDQDPVGEYGQGIFEVTNWLCSTGHKVTTKVYSGYRHEIHNYSDLKDEVEKGITDFMDGVLNG